MDGHTSVCPCRPRSSVYNLRPRVAGSCYRLPNGQHFCTLIGNYLLGEALLSDDYSAYIQREPYEAPEVPRWIINDDNVWVVNGIECDGAVEILDVLYGHDTLYIRFRREIALLRYDSLEDPDIFRKVMHNHSQDAASLRFILNELFERGDIDSDERYDRWLEVNVYEENVVKFFVHLLLPPPPRGFVWVNRLKQGEIPEMKRQASGSLYFVPVGNSKSKIILYDNRYSGILGSGQA